jgi:DNA-binding Lrp family transcriptional regulator
VRPSPGSSSIGGDGRYLSVDERHPISPSVDTSRYRGRGLTMGKAGLKRAIGLSDMDLELIKLLQIDGRRSYAELSRRLSLPQRQVRNRLTELCESGVIYITAVGDPSVLGYRTQAIVAMRGRGRPIEEIAADLAELDAVDYVNLTAGRYDLWINMLCRNLGQLNEIVERSIRVLPGIDHVEVFPYLWLHYQEAAFRTPERVESLTHVSPEMSVDELDRRIVAELSDDGRMPLNQVADAVGTSETQVRRRLKRLQRSGAVRIMAITTPVSQGFETIARLAIVVSTGHTRSAVADAVAKVPAVTFVSVVTGRYDIFCEVVSVNTDELGAILEEIHLIEGVGRCEVFVHIGPLHYKPLRPAMLRES